MSQINTEALINLIKKFFETIQNSSLAINTGLGYSKETAKYIKMSIKLDSEIDLKFKNIAESNLALRDLYNTIYNICTLLSINFNYQKELIENLKKYKSIDDKSEKKLNYKIFRGIDSIQKALSIFQNIITKNNEIILLDYLISYHKQFQRNHITQIEKISPQILQISEEVAAAGNQTEKNSLFFKNNINQLNEILKNKISLNELLKEFKKALTAEEKIIKDSFSQIQFSEKLKNLAEKTCESSETINEFILLKYQHINNNLEHIAEGAVIFSLEIVEYLKSKEITSILENNEFSSAEERKSTNNLNAYIQIACDKIENLIDLNNSMVEIFDLNIKNEEQILELAKMEVECFTNLKQETDKLMKNISSTNTMSSENIRNGNTIEKTLKAIISS